MRSCLWRREINARNWLRTPSRNCNNKQLYTMSNTRAKLELRCYRNGEPMLLLCRLLLKRNRIDFGECQSCFALTSLLQTGDCHYTVMTEPLMLSNLAGVGSHSFKVKTAFATEMCGLRGVGWWRLLLQDGCWFWW